MSYTIKYFGNEIKIVKSECLYKDSCKAKGELCELCDLTMEQIRVRMIGHYTEKLMELEKLSDEELFKEYLL